MLRRKEVFQFPAEFRFWKIVESLDPDLDPCETICAMMAWPGTNLEGESRASRTSRERRDGLAMNGNWYDVSTIHPKPLFLSFLFLFLPSCFHA